VSDMHTSPEVDAVSGHIFLNVLGIQAMLAVPLLIGGEPIGWLLVESLTGPYEFDEREIRLYHALADQAAITVQNLRLIEESQRSAIRERNIAEITAKVRAATTVDTVLRTTIEELCRTLDSVGMVRLVADDTSDVVE
ncbi:MAG: GAF domain-containing protein, partial [Anaerolineae bacterium]|nr:GAF domain-containing protein [Anaerolineae bacterium]